MGWDKEMLTGHANMDIHLSLLQRGMELSSHNYPAYGTCQTTSQPMDHPTIWPELPHSDAVRKAGEDRQFELPHRTVSTCEYEISLNKKHVQADGMGGCQENILVKLSRGSGMKKVSKSRKVS